MRKLFSILFLSIPFYIIGQANDDTIRSNDEEIFINPETPPKFPGGSDQFKNFLNENLHY